MATTTTRAPEEIVLQLIAEHDRRHEVALRATDDLHEARQALGAGLRALREARELSRAAVAERLDVTVSHLIGVEMGRPVTNQERRRLLRALGVRRPAAHALPPREQLRAS